MSNQKILVVDDSSVARLMIKKVLSKVSPDFQISEAKSGNEAIEVAAASYPDMAILDYNIPDFDGLVLASELRSVWPNIPIILITGNLKSDIEHSANSMGVAYLPKPLTAEEKRSFFEGLAAFIEKSTLAAA